MNSKLLFTILAMLSVIIVGLLAIYDIITVGDQFISQMLILFFHDYKINQLDD